MIGFNETAIEIYGIWLEYQEKLIIENFKTLTHKRGVVRDVLLATNWRAFSHICDFLQDFIILSRLVKHDM